MRIYSLSLPYLYKTSSILNLLVCVFFVFFYCTAHRTLGGDVAESLQQVPGLAKPADDEENLTSPILKERRGKDESV